LANTEGAVRSAQLAESLRQKQPSPRFEIQSEFAQMAMFAQNRLTLHDSFLPRLWAAPIANNNSKESNGVPRISYASR
jgi:hypothetical protein